MRPDCRSARARSGQAVGHDDAPTVCTSCQAPLKPRKVRRGDSPFGRWCHRRACIRHRDDVVASLGGGTPGGEKAQLAAEFALAALTQGDASCPACSTDHVVLGFIHPARSADGAVVVCNALGSKGVQVSLASKRWPDFFPDES